MVRRMRRLRSIFKAFIHPNKQTIHELVKKKTGLTNLWMEGREGGDMEYGGRMLEA